MMSDKFHRAAKDGNMDILSVATRRDCNRPDEDGMTPTLLAAYSGNLWALRLIIGRGGNPEQCDVLGNTALHHAASNCHVNCSQFLIAYGCNIWAVDNDLHSAFDHASLYDHTDIVKLLDNAMLQQLSKNKKTVEKLKMKAISEAEKNRKKFQRLQSDTQKRIEKDQRLSRQNSTQQQTHQNKIKSASGTLRRMFATIKIKHDMGTVSSTGPLMYSDYINGTKKGNKMERKLIENMDSNLKINGRNSIIMLDKDKQMTYSQANNRSKRYSWAQPNTYFQNFKETERYNNTNDSGIFTDEGSEKGLFTRPHFGSLAFLPKSLTAHHLQSLPSDNTSDECDTEESMAELNKNTTPWSDVYSKVDEADDRYDYSALETFLVAHNLSDYLINFTLEKVDFDAMLLLTEEDMKQMGLPLGPRKKLCDLIYRHREILQEADCIEDTYL